jgi:hypothetical protein
VVSAVRATEAARAVVPSREAAVPEVVGVVKVLAAATGEPMVVAAAMGAMGVAVAMDEPTVASSIREGVVTPAVRDLAISVGET